MLLVDGFCYTNSDNARRKDSITVKNRGIQKKIMVYPAMWAEPLEEGVIHISDFCIKYAQPYAVQKIIENFRYK